MKSPWKFQGLFPAFQDGKQAGYVSASCRTCKGMLCSVTGKRDKRGDDLKISIHVEETVEDTEITICCGRLTPEIEKILATLRMMDKKLMVTRGEETYILDVSRVVYIESVDRKTFVYTEKEVYESGLKLYELEHQLEEYGFFRASKSCVAALKYIKSLKADINRKIKVTLENGEQIMVSRQYAEELRKKLGVK